VSARVLIVDDHADFRALARTLLEAGGLEVVGEAHDGASALEAARRLKPGVILIDVGLPDLDGFELCERLAGDAAVVMTSSRGASTYRGRLAASSARGFIAKAELTGHALAALAAPE